MFRTLIVEDNDIFRHSLRDMLSGQFPCMEVDEAGDGSEAFDIMAQRLPQLIFMDIKLPGANGLDLTRTIHGQHSDIVIVVITSYDIPEYRDAALASGADYFLPKTSSSATDILQCIDNAFPMLCA